MCVQVSHMHATMVSTALPLMVAIVANYRPEQTITTAHTQSSLDIWTHTPVTHCIVTSAAPPTVFTCTNAVVCRGFSIHFLKKSTLTFKLVYGLPTLLLLYVFPLEAITAQTTFLAPTFLYSFITFGQRAGLFMSSMHYARWKNKLDDTWINNDM